MNIVYACTKDYLPKLVPSITSLLDHNEAEIYVVTEADSTDSGNIHTVDIRDQQWFPKGSVNYQNPFTYINLLKVCYPSILSIDKVIHLDADTIICDSLLPMWETDVTNKWFAAVREDLGWYKPFGSTYYNMGVALINLYQMREDGIEQTLADYLNSFKQPFADQDAWNKFALERDKAVALPVRYNENFATGQTDDPAIVHYCGNPNWWNDTMMPRRSFLDRYMK